MSQKQLIWAIQFFISLQKSFPKNKSILEKIIFPKIKKNGVNHWFIVGIANLHLLIMALDL